VAEEKGAALSEARRDAVVHVVRREPVHAPDIDAQPLQEALAHLVPTELLAFLLRLGANGADQPGAAFSLEREDGGKVALVDGDVQLAVHQRPAGLDVSDVEKVLIGAPRITDAELLAHGRARAVAAGEECGLARRSSQMRHDTAARFLEIEQLSLSLDAHVQLFEPLDEEALVLVLWVDEPVWIGTPAHAQLAEIDVRRLPASGPEVRCGEHQPGFDDLIGEAELAVELKRARLQRQRARSGAGLGSLIDDAEPDAEPGEPESEDEARRAGADDEHFGVHASDL